MQCLTKPIAEKLSFQRYSDVCECLAEADGVNYAILETSFFTSP